MGQPLVNGRVDAPWGWSSAHLQTIRSRVRPVRVPATALGEARLLRVDVDDGSGDRLSVMVHRPRASTPGPVIASSSAAAPATMVAVVHGLGGSAESSYVLRTTAALVAVGFAVARVDLRGAGRAGPTSSELYHAGRTSDLRTVLRALARQSEAAPAGPDGGGTEPRLALVGFSLGGNLTLKLLGEPLEGLPVVAGIAVSAPLDLGAGAEHLHHVAFGLYERYLLRGLRADVERFGGAMSATERAEVRSARRIEEFDTVFTARRNGWRDAAEYYAVNSSLQYLDRIEVPTLVIHALDDPMVPSGPYRAVDWAALAVRGHVQRAITARGGHVGFHQRGNRPPWYVEQARSFLLRNGRVWG